IMTTANNMASCIQSHRQVTAHRFEHRDTGFAPFTLLFILQAPQKLSRGFGRVVPHIHIISHFVPDLSRGPDSVEYSLMAPVLVPLIVLAWSTWCALQDARWGRISNWLTYPAMAAA